MAADLYKIVIYRLEESDKQVVATEGHSLPEARRLARLMCGKAWTMDRRPDINTCGNVVMAIVKQR